MEFDTLSVSAVLVNGWPGQGWLERCTQSPDGCTHNAAGYQGALNAKK